MSFLAEVINQETNEVEFLESSEYSDKEEFALALNQEGYIVKQVVSEDHYKTW